MSEIKDMMKLEDAVVENAAGGNDGCNGCYSTVCGLKTGYLAMRTQPYYSEANEIGCLYNGDCVQIVSGIIGGKDGHNYVVVYSPKLGKQGYVNAAYVC